LMPQAPAKYRLTRAARALPSVRWVVTVPRLD
jgi:hypothetical protein